MEVQFKLNTEKEDICELKKLQSWLNELIEKRETSVNARIEQQKQEEVTAAQHIAEQPVVHSSAPPASAQQTKKDYSSHGRIIDYEDISETMSKIYGGG